MEGNIEKGRARVVSPELSCVVCQKVISKARKPGVDDRQKSSPPKCKECRPKSPKKKLKTRLKRTKETWISVPRPDKDNKKMFLQREHEEAVKMVDPHLECQVCGKRFPLGGKWKFQKHVESHAAAEGLSCKECKKSFKHKSTLIAHR